MRSFSATLTIVVLLGLARFAPAADVPVLVLPFADTGGGNASWVGESIQQSLVGDVGRGGAFTPVTTPSAGQPSGDLALAISAARQANVPYVVFGSYQVQGDRFRVVANAVDVQNMRFVGGVNVGRNTREIFNATDALGSHVIGHLNRARGNAVDGVIQAPGNAVGASPISRVQMPLTSVPFSYVDWASKARPKTQRSSQWAKMLPGQLVVDYPLEHIPNRLLPPSRDPRAPFNNQIQGGDGNQITRSDGDSITGGDGNTMLRGDGNTMGFNRGARTGASNVPGAGAGNSVSAPAGGAVRPQAGRAVQPGSGNAVRPGSGNAVTPNSGRANAPQGQR